MIDIRRKGIEFEQNICKVLRHYGFKADSTRAVYKKLDNRKVDIVTSAPFNIQCKRMEKLRPSPVTILNSMPIKKGKTRVLIHKASGKPATVTLLMADFERLHLAPNLDKWQ